MRWLVLALVALSATAACGGESEEGASGGAGGTSATGGGGTGGAGTGGTSTGGTSTGGASTGGSSTGGASTGGSSTGGVAGSGGATGGTGASSTGGVGGTGGVASPECTSAGDCKVFEDCCSCEGVPKTENPAICKMACTDMACKQLGVSPTEVACVAGRCVKAFDCDLSKVTCKMAEPACAPGETPQVSGTCYTGKCVKASECHDVPSCSKCASTDACTTYVTQMGYKNHCVSVPTACSGAMCDCFGPSTCVAPYTSCQDKSGVKGVSCDCPTC